MTVIFHSPDDGGMWHTGAMGCKPSTAALEDYPRFVSGKPCPVCFPRYVEAMEAEQRATCLLAWPDAQSGSYDPRCCRFPKSCSIPDDAVAMDAVTQDDAQAARGILSDERAANESLSADLAAAHEQQRILVEDCAATDDRNNAELRDLRARIAAVEALCDDADEPNGGLWQLVPTSALRAALARASSVPAGCDCGYPEGPHRTCCASVPAEGDGETERGACCVHCNHPERYEGDHAEPCRVCTLPAPGGGANVRPAVGTLPGGAQVYLPYHPHATTAPCGGDCIPHPGGGEDRDTTLDARALRLADGMDAVGHHGEAEVMRSLSGEERDTLRREVLLHGTPGHVYSPGRDVDDPESRDPRWCNGCGEPVAAGSVHLAAEPVPEGEQ